MSAEDVLGDPEPYENMGMTVWWGMSPTYFAGTLVTDEGMTETDGLMIEALDGSAPHFFPRPVAMYMWACIGTLMEQYGWDVEELKHHKHGHDHDDPNHTHG